jgi:hypothetical protein
MCAAPMGMMAAGGQRTNGDALAAWAETRLECSGEHGTDFGTAGQWWAAPEGVTKGHHCTGLRPAVVSR